MIGSLVARTAAGLNAFVAGRRFGQEWAQGLWFENEVRKVIAREPAGSLAVGAVALGVAGFSALRRKEIVALALAGWFVGSGGLDRLMTRLGATSTREPVVLARRQAAAPGSALP